MSSKPIFNAGTERFVRDWRNTIATITVRDQRYRQHDPILGVIPLRLTDVLQTSSQVTRWYPLDSGIGFGRARISVLFRSVETRLPPFMLGWDVGTFELDSERILATGYHSSGKIKMRTGGSSGTIQKTSCKTLEEGDGLFWDLSQNQVRLPVKFRYRSPVVFEFHASQRRGVKAFATIWLHHLIDNEVTDINIPIWSTKNGNRLTQNYITEENIRAKQIPGLEDLEEVGRLQFRGRFKAGTDESHELFVVDSESRETFETWEACMADGTRARIVSPVTPSRVDDLHNQSLAEGRDVLEQAEPAEREKWLSRDGTDWSGAFGHNPKAYVDSKGRKRAEPGVEKPIHDPINPSSDEDGLDESSEGEASSEDLGLQDATNTNSAKSMSGASQAGLEKSDKVGNEANKRSEKRKQRGLMQWKPMRNAEFAKNEAKFAVKRLKKRITGDLGGREPDVETEA